MISTVLAGCASRASKTVAVIPQRSDSELWESLHAGTQRAGRESGFRIYWNAPTREDDVEKQIALVQRVVRNESVGLVLAPDQYLALVAPVREALDKGIPTVIVQTPLSIPPGGGLSYILNDDEATGRIAAERLGRILNGKGTVAVLGIDPNVTGTVLRAHAFAAHLASNFPAIAISERRVGSPNSAETQRAADEILASNPKITAILGLNTAATQGALAAMRVLDKSQKIKLMGCDQEINLMAALRRGEIDSIVAENSYEMGYRAVRSIAEQRQGRSVQSEMKLQPVLITRENIDTPQVQKLLSVDWRLNP
jgi:ribose transport system substrate-binding protein